MNYKKIYIPDDVVSVLMDPPSDSLPDFALLAIVKRIGFSSSGSIARGKKN